MFDIVMMVAPWTLAVVCLGLMFVFGREALLVEEAYHITHHPDHKFALRSAYKGWCAATGLTFILMIIFIFAGL
ncbi:hypothetical protein LOKG_00071 [Loktanella phage pCB2051-A]|uniref:Uncharacterized protein n=1 Tax=Loktanella phage pCB2051-A TaxID=754044 RepID=M4R1C6_9CAUD|nr:hypothetical protein LOKG_00071 [Loktanella phage pCB2051-A]AGH31507.1 hypothetical protein LOKG_00071 [Loktanella phage pCB2051-A]